MSLDTTMVSIHPHFKIKDGKMDQCIALLEEKNALIYNYSPVPDPQGYFSQVYLWNSEKKL